MDISVQNFNEFDGGFSDDSEYGNFLGIRGKKYYAKRREEQAKATATAEQNAAVEAKKTAEALAQESKRKLDEANALLQSRQASMPTSSPTPIQTVGSGSGGATKGVVVDASTPTPEAPKSNKKLFIIGGVALVGVIAIVLLMRK
jgi:cobalamin biosynthesis Mg chelatase CobN